MDKGEAACVDEITQYLKQHVYFRSPEGIIPYEQVYFVLETPCQVDNSDCIWRKLSTYAPVCMTDQGRFRCSFLVICGQ